MANHRNTVLLKTITLVDSYQTVANHITSYIHELAYEQLSQCLFSNRDKKFF